MAARPSLVRIKVPPAPAPEPSTARPPRTAKPAAREGKVQLGAYIAVEAKRQLDVHAATEGKTLQAIVEEMIDDYAGKHGLHRLAKQKAAAE